MNSTSSNILKENNAQRWEHSLRRLVAIRTWLIWASRIAAAFSFVLVLLIFSKSSLWFFALIVSVPMAIQGWSQVASIDAQIKMLEGARVKVGLRS
jgi:1,4-dihydroxy-2-naphthoate octaprenyltransferase